MPMYQAFRRSMVDRWSDAPTSSLCSRLIGLVVVVVAVRWPCTGLYELCGQCCGSWWLSSL